MLPAGQASTVRLHKAFSAYKGSIQAISSQSLCVGQAAGFTSSSSNGPATCRRCVLGDRQRGRKESPDPSLENVRDGDSGWCIHWLRWPLGVQCAGEHARYGRKGPCCRSGRGHWFRAFPPGTVGPMWERGPAWERNQALWTAQISGSTAFIGFSKPLGQDNPSASPACRSGGFKPWPCQAHLGSHLPHWPVHHHHLGSGAL